jgi:hypothetical protein
VVGLRFACVLAVDFRAGAAVRFFFVDDFLAVVAVVDPDVTREECFGRWRTAFFGAASANELSANDASSASTNIFMV